ncbi:hypothetical protein B0H13DRAFT_2309116 [Mycena leptocephala]|nr:hypothetical protein B0H13DRAFT_2309116 [Mycena leptocephala]
MSLWPETYAASVLTALSVPETPLGPLLAELKARLATALGGAVISRTPVNTGSPGHRSSVSPLSSGQQANLTAPTIGSKCPLDATGATTSSTEQGCPKRQCTNRAEPSVPLPAESRSASKAKGKMKRKPCVGKGDAARVGGDKDIGRVDCAVGTCDNCDSARGGENEGTGDDNDSEGDDQVDPHEEGSGGKKTNVGWIVDPEGGPPLTLNAGKVLGCLLGIFTSASRQNREDLLIGLSTMTRFTDCSALEGAVECVNVDSAKKEAVIQCLPKVTGDSLVQQFASKGVVRRTFLDWLTRSEINDSGSCG